MDNVIKTEFDELNIIDMKMEITEHVCQQQIPQETSQQDQQTIKRPLDTESPGKYRASKRGKSNYEAVKRFRERQKLSKQIFLQKQQALNPVVQKPEKLTRLQKAYNDFDKKFKNNEFGHMCMICDRLWFKSDLYTASEEHKDILQKILTNFSSDVPTLICSTCKAALDKKKIPAMATYNGFKYPLKPAHLPGLDIISERFVSPRIPFMQIRRMRHVHGQYDISMINIPVSDLNMVEELPRDIDDDHCYYVHIKKKLIHKSSYLQKLINKQTIKIWLEYLVDTPLYAFYKIKINQKFLQDVDEDVKIVNDDICEDISVDENLITQQYTLLWDRDNFLTSAPGEHNVPYSLLFDEHAEELSFPEIYLGQFRNYKENITVTPFMTASSELRRVDRRGVTPNHLLYLAMKIMRIRVRDGLTDTLKTIGTDMNVTQQKIESEKYLNSCIENNLTFLRCIPNSIWYWTDKKRDLLAIIRQKGKPTAFMNLTANETGWTDLLQLLYKLRNNGAVITKEAAANLKFIEKNTLINNDAVTCTIYFNKLINVLLNILQSKKFSPFGKYRVADYFTRIEFQQHGSPHAHVLLWLDNAPNDVLGENYSHFIELIDTLISVSASQASDHIKLQRHQHTSTCYINALNVQKKCRFEVPFMPCRSSMILTPLESTADDVSEEDLKIHRSHYLTLKNNLKNIDYSSIDDFYEKNHIDSDQHYTNILRAGINQVEVFLKREPSEKWINPFNPFVLSIMGSYTDFQLITDENSCALYIAEYANKTNKGMSDLRKKIIETMNEHLEFDIGEMTRNMSVDILNSVEMTSQEAAWYLLREPMSTSSIQVVCIPTIRPLERQKVKKNQRQLREMDEDFPNVWKENWFDKYEQRPEELKDVTLAQFVSVYYKNTKDVFVKRPEPHVIRYRNYNIETNINEYKREMVTLHTPFRNEEKEILIKNKFIQIYDKNEELILNRRNEFECKFDIEKTLKICRLLCRNNEEPDDG